MMILKNYKKFGNVLNNRFHTILSHLENTSGNFTAFIQAINRSDPQKINQKTLSYIGLQEQKKRLTKSRGIELDDHEVREDEAWKFLGETDFRDKTIRSYSFYNDFRKGKLKIQDVETQSLSLYFKEITNDPQRAEYDVLSKYFEIDGAFFITLPLIQFGDFDGLVYVVFDGKDKVLYDSLDVKVRIIKNFSIEYEKLLLQWDKVPFDSQQDDLNSHLSFLQSDEYYEIINTNPILVSLSFKQYYLDSDAYYRLHINRFYKEKILDAATEKKNSTKWEMSEILKTAFHQFLVYFIEYAKNFYNVDIDVQIERIPEGLRLTSSNLPEEIVFIDNLLSQYLDGFLTQKYDSLLLKNDVQDQFQRFIYDQNLRELRMENHILKGKIENLIEKIDLINLITGTEEDLQVKVNFFNRPNINSIIFSKNLEKLDVNSISQIRKGEIEKKLYSDVRSLLEEGEIKNALQALKGYFEKYMNVERQNELTMIIAANNQLEKDKKLGAIHEDVLKIEHRRILNLLLKIISE